MTLINSHIEQSALRVNTRLSTTDKQGATAATIAGRMLLVDTNVITTHTIILGERGRERERERNYKHPSWTWPTIELFNHGEQIDHSHPNLPHPALII